MRRQTSWRVRRLLNDRSIQSADWRAHSTVPGDDEARERIACEQSRSVAQPIRAALSHSQTELVPALRLLSSGLTHVSPGLTCARDGPPVVGKRGSIASTFSLGTKSP